MVSDGEDSSSTSTPRAGAASTVQVVGLIRVVFPFDENHDDWVEYTEHLVHYFTANDISNVAKKRAILLNRAGASTYTRHCRCQERRGTVHFHPKPFPDFKTV